MFGGKIRPTIVSSFLSLIFISRLFFILKFHPIYSRWWTRWEVVEARVEHISLTVYSQSQLYANRDYKQVELDT